MMRQSAAVMVGAFALCTAACDNFLDVNENPNGPTEVAPNMYLAPMIHNMVTGPQLDSRFIGRFTQEWVVPQNPGNLPNLYERHGVESNDNGGEQWRNVYWQFGYNLINMIDGAEAQERWDLLGIGYTMKAWGWLAVTTTYGEVIVSEAFIPDKYYFKYDPQEDVYEEVFRLLDLAIENLKRTDGTINPGYIAVGDKIYNGDRLRWLKLAYGLKAMALNHYSNKASYSPAAVIAAVDSSLTSSADDALFPYANASTVFGDDRNFWGQSRQNYGSYRQSKFLVELMDGTQFGGVADPRMKRMLAPSPDSVWRGIDPNVGFSSVVSQRPNNLVGYTSIVTQDSLGRYVFDDKVKFPFMTYFQLQFVKAEAALRANNPGVARTAYLNAVGAHIDFVNARNTETRNTRITQITAAEKQAFLASPEIAPAAITLSHIMSQKFIAQYGWGHDELWMDMRRYHYTDMDPVSGTQVFRGWTPVTSLNADNGGKLAQRLRPRWNSEYVWNRQSLNEYGGLALDYHTKPLWITERQ